MTVAEWQSALRQLSDLVFAKHIADYEFPQFPEDVIAAGYLGFPGATEEQILAAEARLGTRLPPSYRNFLLASNGWTEMGSAMPGKLWSVEEIDWLRVRNQEAIDGWGNEEDNDLSPDDHRASGGERGGADYRGAYMQNCLEISDWGDACILFLCPEVVTPDGEWECWKLASWIPGVNRADSFQDWMAKTFDFFQDIDAFQTIPGQS